MILSLTTKNRVRKTLLAALAGGLAGGAIYPALAPALGAPAARAAFAAIAAATVLLVRGARGVPARAAIAAGLGALSAALEGSIHGLAPAIAGLGLALVIAPEGHASGFARVLRALTGALGALLAAVGVGALAGTLEHASAPAWDALLGAGLALGATAGELVHHFVLLSTRPPAELAQVRDRLGLEWRASVERTRGAYVRVCEAVIAATGLEAQDRIEAIATARDLAVTAARASVQADEVARAQASLNLGRPSSDEVRATRERVSEQLGRKLEKSRDDAQRAAAAIDELAVAIAERGAKADTRAADLEARARGLAFRIGTPAPAPATGKEA